jgi:hypothetical protein
MMSGMSAPAGWGPSHQTLRRRLRRPWWFQLPMYALVVVWYITSANVAVLVALVVGGLVALSVIERTIKRTGRVARGRVAVQLVRAEDPQRAVRALCWKMAAGSFASPALSVRCWCSGRRAQESPAA